MQKINSDIKSGSFDPVYLLFGEEAYLRRSYKNRLRQAMVGDDTMNYTYYEGKDFSATELMGIAETLPFFADRRLIIAENTGLFKKEAGELADYLDRMPDTTHLIDVYKRQVHDLDGVLAEFDRVIGLEHLKAIHLNDSQNPMGSRKDRHAKIGEGTIGLPALSAVTNHPLLRTLPFVLETPNDEEGYAREIRILRERYRDE